MIASKRDYEDGTAFEIFSLENVRPLFQANSSEAYWRAGA